MNTNKEVNKQEERPKPVKERNDIDLLGLVCQLHSRALTYPTKEMHDAYVEAFNEMQSRLVSYAASKSSIDTGVEEAAKETNSDGIEIGIANLINALVYYSQIHTVRGVCPVNMPTHEQAWKLAQQWLYKNCKANEYGDYFLRASSGEAVDWVDANTTPPTQNGYYICWCRNPSEPGLIHYHKDTGWQNGFYDDRVTHYKLLTPPKP